ncbi:HAD family hydrolase [Streptomyces radiopugnans]|uniref:HAD family hydrolase n=1 Tax=Streptomyces radiopugnans TaxID=403935 RepID=UPI003F1CC57A
MPLWFAGTLRDGSALAAAEAYADFADVALDGLRSLLPGVRDWSGETEAAARHIVDGFARRGTPRCSGRCAQAEHGRIPGFRLVTMTNGSARLTERLLAGAGLPGFFEALLDAGRSRCWKPARAAYRYAVEQAEARPEQAVLVTAHPWDVDGATRAGLAGAWLRRGSTAYPRTMARPAHSTRDLRELADTLTAGRT